MKYIIVAIISFALGFLAGAAFVEAGAGALALEFGNYALELIK